MSFSSYLESLRAKPDHIKKKYAFFTSLGVTAMIFLFWISSFSANSFNSAIPDSVAKTDTPAQSLVASVGSLFTDIKDLIFGPKKITYSTIEVLPGK